MDQSRSLQNDRNILEGQMLGFKSFYKARRVLIGMELVKKMVKGQYQVPARFGSSLHFIWHHVLAS